MQYDSTFHYEVPDKFRRIGGVSNPQRDLIFPRAEPNQFRVAKLAEVSKERVRRLRAILCIIQVLQCAIPVVQSLQRTAAEADRSEVPEACDCNASLGPR